MPLVQVCASMEFAVMSGIATPMGFLHQPMAPVSATASKTQIVEISHTALVTFATTTRTKLENHQPLHTKQKEQLAVLTQSA